MQHCAMAQLLPNGSPPTPGPIKLGACQRCPKCLQAGKSVKLKLCQINFSEAMCSEENCVFPFSESNIEAYVIQRSLSQFRLRSKRRKKRSLNHSTGTPSVTQSIPPNTFSFNASDTMDQLERFLNNSSLLAIADQQSPQLLDMDTQQIGSGNECNNSPESNDMANVFDGLDSIFMKVPENEFDQLQPDETFLPYKKKCSLSNGTKSKTLPTSNQVKTAVDPTRVDCAKAASDTSVSIAFDTNCQQLLSDRTENSPAHSLKADTVMQTHKADTVMQTQKADTVMQTQKADTVMQTQNGLKDSWFDSLLYCIVNSTSIRMFLNKTLDESSRSTNIFHRLCCVYDCLQEHNSRDNCSVLPGSNTPAQSYDSMLNDIRREIYEMLHGADLGTHDMISTFLSLDHNLRELYFTQTRCVPLSANEPLPLGTQSDQSNPTIIIPQCPNENDEKQDHFPDKEKRKTDSTCEMVDSQTRNSTSEERDAWHEKENAPKVDFSADDIEMLTQACEELKSSPPSPVSPNNGFVVEPVISRQGPLTDLKPITIVPYNIAVNMPKRRVNSSLMKKPINVKQEKRGRPPFENENSVVTSSRVANDNLKSFDSFQPNYWPRAKIPCRKFQLKSYRKEDLKRICSGLNQKTFLSLTSPMNPLPQYQIKAMDNGPPLLTPDITDSLPDLDVFSNSSELSDIFPDLDLLSNCST